MNILRWMSGHELGLSNSGCNSLIKAAIYARAYIALSLLQWQMQLGIW